MEVLFVEMVNEILLRLGRPSLFYAAQVNRQWRLLALKQTVPIQSSATLKKVCQEGDRLSLVRSSFNNDWLRGGFISACYGGHREIVELLVQKGANFWGGGFIGACKGGHRELVELMIKKGGLHPHRGLYSACHGGHWELVRFLIQKGREQWLWSIFSGYWGEDDWDEGLYGACRGGHRDLAELMIENGADCWNWGLQGACDRGHKILVNLMIEKGATQCSCGKSIDQH